ELREDGCRRVVALGHGTMGEKKEPVRLTRSGAEAPNAPITGVSGGGAYGAPASRGLLPHCGSELTGDPGELLLCRFHILPPEAVDRQWIHAYTRPAKAGLGYSTGDTGTTSRAQLTGTLVRRARRRPAEKNRGSRLR